MVNRVDGPMQAVYKCTHILTSVDVYPTSSPEHHMAFAFDDVFQPESGHKKRGPRYGPLEPVLLRMRQNAVELRGRTDSPGKAGVVFISD